MSMLPAVAPHASRHGAVDLAGALRAPSVSVFSVSPW
jgi:hypothetical protein